MAKTQHQIRNTVETAIEGFLASFIDEYITTNSNINKETCRQYTIEKATKGKQEFVSLFSLRYSKEEINSFKTIEDSWLFCVETPERFEVFLQKIKKII